MLFMFLSIIARIRIREERLLADAWGSDSEESMDDRLLTADGESAPPTVRPSPWPT